MKNETKIKIENYLNNVTKEINILDYIDVEDIDIENPFYSIYDLLRDTNAFNVDVIYYHEAINYLKEFDNSLKLSLQIAEDYGYTLKDINSELLASLLASENLVISFCNLQTEIEDFFVDMIKSEF